MTRLTIELPEEVAVAFVERAKAVRHVGAEAYLQALAPAEAALVRVPKAHEPHTWPQVEAKVREALEDPSAPIRMTPEKWEELRREGKERIAALKARST